MGETLSIATKICTISFLSSPIVKGFWVSMFNDLKVTK